VDDAGDLRVRHGAEDDPPKLLKAAALAGKDEGPLPREVEDELERRALGVPLMAGGLLDQPVRRRLLMRAAHNVYSAFRAYRLKTTNDVDWSEQYPEQWKIVAEIEKEILTDDQSEPS
jgi:hypothetical protein